MLLSTSSDQNAVYSRKLWIFEKSIETSGFYVTALIAQERKDTLHAIFYE